MEVVLRQRESVGGEIEKTAMKVCHRIVRSQFQSAFQGCLDNVQAIEKDRIECQQFVSLRIILTLGQAALHSPHRFRILFLLEEHQPLEEECFRSFTMGSQLLSDLFFSLADLTCVEELLNSVP